MRFEDSDQWQAFRDLPVVRAALDAVPDPVNGLLIYRGRGGSSAAGKPRKPRPAPSAAAAALPEPEPESLPRPHPQRAAGHTGRAAGRRVLGQLRRVRSMNQLSIQV